MYYVRHYFAKGQKLNLKAFQKQNAIDHKPYSIGGRLLEAVPARQPGSIRLGRAVAAQEPCRSYSKHRRWRGKYNTGGAAEGGELIF